MGLPSAINLRIAQVDPGSLIPAPSRASDSSGAFEQHLDATDTPAARAADRRDEQRQRESDGGDVSQTSTQGNQSASQSGQDASPASTTPSADPSATTGTETATGDAAATAEASTETTGAASTPPDAETTSAAAEAGLSNARAAIAGDAAKNAKPDGDKAEKDKAPDQSGDTTLAALLMPQTAPRQQTPVTPTTPASVQPAPAASSGAPQPNAPDDATLAAASAAQSALGDAQTDTGEDGSATGGEADLAVKPKLEGLGHQAAAAMAEKSSDRQAAAQTIQAPTPQTANPQAVAAVQTATNLTGTAGGTSGDTGTQPITATSGTLAAQLTDLQSAGASQQSNTNNTTIRIGTLPGQTTPSVVPSMAIALQIARNVQKGINRFDIRLDPPELGRIDVRMEVQRDGHVAAHLTVESAQTLDLLQRDQRALQQALTDAGLQANSDSLSFSLRDQNAGGNAQGSAGNGGGSGGSSEIASVEETAASSGPIYNLNLSASGGVDIRV